jgi:hypothetical protein
VEKWLFSVTLHHGGTFSSTAIEIIKWVKFFAVAQAKVTHITASEKTPKGVIPSSLCEISQNASRKKTLLQGLLQIRVAIFKKKSFPETLFNFPSVTPRVRLDDPIFLCCYLKKSPGAKSWQP